MVIYPLLVSFLLHSTLGNTVTSYKQREREKKKRQVLVCLYPTHTTALSRGLIE